MFTVFSDLYKGNVFASLLARVAWVVSAFLLFRLLLSAGVEFAVVELALSCFGTEAVWFMGIVLPIGEGLVELLFGTDDTAWPFVGTTLTSELGVVVLFFGTDIVVFAWLVGATPGVLCLASGETSEVSVVTDIVATVVYKVDFSLKVRFRKSLPNLIISMLKS